MPEIRVFLSEDVAPEGVNVAAEVLDTETLEGVDIVLTAGQATAIDLDTGLYVVRALPARSAAVSATIDVGAEAAEVLIGGTRVTTSAADRSERIARVDRSYAAQSEVYQVASDGVVYRSATAGPWASSSADAGSSKTADAAKTTEAEHGLTPTTLKPGWLQVWAGDEAIDPDHVTLHRDDSQVTVRIEDRSPRQYSLQVGGVDLAWRVTQIPSARPIDVIVRASSPGTDFDEGVEVLSVSGDPKVASLESYLSVGKVERASSVVQPVLDDVRDMFDRKVEDPGGAAVAGYYLLATRQQDMLGEWPANFANWFDWLADAQVIRAWQLLREPDLPRKDEARARLLRASELDPPAYTAGLRLLYDGLRLLVGDGEEPASSLRAAVERVRGFADACCWHPRITTYWAKSPREPSLTRRSGDAPNPARAFSLAGA